MEEANLKLIWTKLSTSLQDSLCPSLCTSQKISDGVERIPVLNRIKMWCIGRIILHRSQFRALLILQLWEVFSQSGTSWLNDSRIVKQNRDTIWQLLQCLRDYLINPVTLQTPVKDDNGMNKQQVSTYRIQSICLAALRAYPWFAARFSITDIASNEAACCASLALYKRIKTIPAARTLAPGCPEEERKEWPLSTLLQIFNENGVLLEKSLLKKLLLLNGAQSSNIW